MCPLGSRLSPPWLCDNSCTWAHDLHHVPKCMSRHKAIVVITGRAQCFHDNIYNMLMLHSVCLGSRMTTQY